MHAVMGRFRREAAAREALRSRARASVAGLASVLVREFGVRKVVLFGSLVHGDLSDAPDIDLLVEGLDPSRFTEALGRLFLLAPLPVDLVPVERGRPEIVQRALEEGEVIHAS